MRPRRKGERGAALLTVMLLVAIIAVLAATALERVAYPMLDGAQPLPPTVLLPRVRALHLRYRFQGAWLDQWQGVQGAALPQAAEVTIERTDGTLYRQMFLVGTGYAPARQVAGA